MTNNVYMHGIPKGKIIRDAVHGDIFVEDKFLKIIDTPEFQRMRRIKQLSVANIVFPSADHTRFSHSLGCFYVMKQIIAHFDSIFGKMGIEVSKQDKDIALLAALLHDIGHGPFSHAFEDIHPKGAAQVSHETWTSRIITCHSGTIYKQIEETFGKGTAEKVSELIEKQRRVKSSEENYIIEKIDIFSVLSSLISSQLDADRLDYLVRDAYNCGVSFGKIDIQRIISALSLTVYVPSLKDKTSELKNTLTIINKREIINILAKKSEAKFEMAFDHVTYQDDSGHKAYDYQIEIELKSDYIHRVNLKMLTDDLERKVSKLESSTESKYKRGLTKLSVQ